MAKEHFPDVKARWGVKLKSLKNQKFSRWGISCVDSTTRLTLTILYLDVSSPLIDFQPKRNINELEKNSL
ncbi:hypothetical protein NEOLI_004356 [Neolecta irregularis DAH-3]|uniref:Uncharacterized protein n=1 Tax=Neolecta irregularis (strain DAH-3) TaxID=1198029 RepID=A0A1U7LMI5_NEOID|nr:hypothetical protein NEOLI_004356 [Neolecta irregularis DAH-3]|eukprot:OLL23838.1 hypothetical protein NEOLI_004356 [Neolecta irregularis DAH-3]